MTASIQNTASSLKVLLNGLKWFCEATHEPIEKRVEYLEILADSSHKCFASVAAQIRFYQSAKSPTRALIVTHEDGRQEYVHGQQVETLVLAQPDKAEDAVVYGKPEALKAIRAALAANGHTVTGPANIHDLSAQVAEAAVASIDPPDKDKAHGNAT
ncbi:hypothetical protein FIV00_14910 [Labrenzia sp. THAF82]|uniref:hypothetical protein n=1 Tax=Labrenzia sp. THAF82 TaxID=2587861 RepID=UPI0012693548|nr:hypothetical protein [Labrenzia sp. THAF82]QFT31780.1 hypothetical protein FIV00_14910 [Labrenzia sp. THAF82]